MLFISIPLNLFICKKILRKRNIITAIKTINAKTSPDAIMISYTSPRFLNTLWVPKSPSIVISMLPIRITQKPQKTNACSNPITGRLIILVWPKATFSISPILFPIRFTEKAGLVILKKRTYLATVNPKTARVMKREAVKTICFIIEID